MSEPERASKSEGDAIGCDAKTNAVVSQSVGFYVYPRIWACEEPPHDPRFKDQERFDVTRLWDVVLEGKLKCGISFRFYRFGFVVFNFFDEDELIFASTSVPDFLKLTTAAITQLEKINAFLLIIRSEMAQRENYSTENSIVRMNDMVLLNDFDDLGKGISFGTSDLSRIIPENVRIPSELLSKIEFDPYFDLRARIDSEFRKVIPKSILEASLAYFDKLLCDGRADLVQAIALLAHAANSLEEHNYAASLIASFPIVETFIQRMWGSFLNNQENKGRKTRMSDHRTYTVAVIAEILSISGLMQNDTFELFSKARKSRNDWVHGLKPVNEQAAICSINAAVALLKVVEGVSLAVPINLRVRFVTGSSPPLQ